MREIVADGNGSEAYGDEWISRMPKARKGKRAESHAGQQQDEREQQPSGRGESRCGSEECHLVDRRKINAERAHDTPWPVEAPLEIKQLTIREIFELS